MFTVFNKFYIQYGYMFTQSNDFSLVVFRYLNGPMQYYMMNFCHQYHLILIEIISFLPLPKNVDCYSINMTTQKQNYTDLG